MSPIRKLSRKIAGLIADRPKKKGIMFVISGPSGCGKTTLCKRLLGRNAGLVNSISVTTRSPRKGEKRNRDYIYVTEDKFKRDLKDKRFLEHAKVFGSYYGTPKRLMADALGKGKDVLLNIDVQGAAQVRKILKDAVFIFILPPTFKDLEKRLSKRSSDSPAQIKRRLKIAHSELRAIDMYNYVVINDDMKKAADELVAIVTAARCRIKRKE